MMPTIESCFQINCQLMREPANLSVFGGIRSGSGQIKKKSINIVSVATELEPWTPSGESATQDVNSAIEDIRTILQKLQQKIGASDQYIYGLLDCISDDYRAQLPSGKA